MYLVGNKIEIRGNISFFYRNGHGQGTLSIFGPEMVADFGTPLSVGTKLETKFKAF